MKPTDHRALHPTITELRSLSIKVRKQAFSEFLFRKYHFPELKFVYLDLRRAPALLEAPLAPLLHHLAEQCQGRADTGQGVVRPLLGRGVPTRVSWA